MSIKLMSTIWDLPDPELNSSRLLLLLALADYANDDGTHCYPSIPTLAQRARLSTRQAQRVIQWLSDNGYILILEKGDGRGKSTRYHVLPKGDNLSTKDDKLSPNSENKRVTFATERVTSSAERVTFATEKGDIAMSPDPPIEPPIEPPMDPSVCASADADVPPTPNAQGDYESIFGKGTTSFDPPAQATPKQSIAEEWNKPLSEMEPHRAMFAAVLDAVGWDRATLTERDRVQVAQVCRILRDAGYEYHDIGDFMQEIWFQDWRWEKNRSRPTLNQIRQEIGKLHAEKPPVNGLAGRNSKVGQTMAAFDEFEALLAARGIR